MLELSVFLFNRFGGTSQDLSKFQFRDKYAEEGAAAEPPVDEVMSLICENVSYADQKMSSCARNYIVKLAHAESKQSKKHENKFIFRKLLNSVIDDGDWAKYSTEKVQTTFKRRLEACKSKLS